MLEDVLSVAPPPGDAGRAMTADQQGIGSGADLVRGGSFGAGR